MKYLLLGLNKLFGKARSKVSAGQQAEEYYQLKQKAIENVLGTTYNIVGHAVIPFEVGGSVDMYYFPDHIPGTGFATMELLSAEGSVSKPNKAGTYELVAFTKHRHCTNTENPTSFDKIERKICSLFTVIASYSSQAVLNPMDTCEIPGDGDEEYTYIILDVYQPAGKRFVVGKQTHHLLLCLQIFKSEMDFAKENGKALLIQKLKDAGHYPYSDLDRIPVA